MNGGRSSNGYGEDDRPGPQVSQSVNRRPCRAARCQAIVDEDDRATRYVDRVGATPVELAPPGQLGLAAVDGRLQVLSILRTTRMSRSASRASATTAATTTPPRGSPMTSGARSRRCPRAAAS
jgi:hypothetical protein